MSQIPLPEGAPKGTLRAAIAVDTWEWESSHRSRFDVCDLIELRANQRSGPISRRCVAPARLLHQMLWRGPNPHWRVFSFCDGIKHFPIFRVDEHIDSRHGWDVRRLLFESRLRSLHVELPY
jgi:hypothetical protein